MNDQDFKLVIPKVSFKKSAAERMPEIFKNSHPQLSMGSGFFQESDQRFMGIEISYTNFSRRVLEVRANRIRAKSWSGRVYNSLTGCATEEVEVSIPVLKSIFTCLEDQESIEAFSGKGHVKLKYELASQILVQLVNAMRAKGLLE